jgi:hypothetical protein
MDARVLQPEDGLFYVPVQDVGATATRRRREFKESIPYWGAGVAVDLEDMAGSISAFDPKTGGQAWRWANEIPMCASTLATGGDLVFAGEPTGEFNALDARSGELLWQFQCGSGHHSSPSTYAYGLGRLDRRVPPRDARGGPGERAVRLRAAGGVAPPGLPSTSGTRPAAAGWPLLGLAVDPDARRVPKTGGAI